jgi:hypothetical protein
MRDFLKEIGEKAENSQQVPMDLTKSLAVSAI